MKYRAVRESSVWKMVLLILLGIAFVWVSYESYKSESERPYIALYGTYVIIVIIYCTYAIWLRWQRSKFYKYGKKYQGKIVRADCCRARRGCDDYFLYIEFKVNGEKMTRKTRAYGGNPNYILDNRYCTIYEYKGKYLEGNFNVLEKEDYKRVKMIPIRNIKFRERVIR